MWFPTGTCVLSPFASESSFLGKTTIGIYSDTRHQQCQPRSWFHAKFQHSHATVTDTDRNTNANDTFSSNSNEARNYSILLNPWCRLKWMPGGNGSSSQCRQNKCALLAKCESPVQCRSGGTRHWECDTVYYSSWWVYARDFVHISSLLFRREGYENREAYRWTGDVSRVQCRRRRRSYIGKIRWRSASETQDNHAINLAFKVVPKDPLLPRPSRRHCSIHYYAGWRC